MSFHRLLILSAVRLRWMALALFALALVGCAGQAAMTPPPLASSVRFGHVFIVVEENANYSDVVASPSMPYLNTLANKYGLATNYFADAHPSIPNYFELTTRQIVTLIDASIPQLCPVSAH